jgi:hypothetical protein
MNFLQRFLGKFKAKVHYFAVICVLLPIIICLRLQYQRKVSYVILSIQFMITSFLPTYVTEKPEAIFPTDVLINLYNHLSKNNRCNTFFSLSITYYALNKTKNYCIFF